MKKAIKFIIVIISLLILFILILKQIELRDYKGKGDVMLEKISNYKELNGELPNNSTDFFYSNEVLSAMIITFDFVLLPRPEFWVLC